MTETRDDLDRLLHAHADEWRRRVGAPAIPRSIADLLATREVVAPARRRAWTVAAAALATSAAVALVALIPPHRPTVTEQAVPATERVSALVGVWAVTADGEPTSTRLRVDADGLSVWRACGEVHGHWRASPDGGFVASFTSFSGACATTQTQAAAETALTAQPWISQARRFHISAA